MRNLGIVVVMALGTLGLAVPALPHHSLAVFDYTTEIEVTGTVTSFVFANPHCFLHLDVRDEAGEVVSWAVEMATISNMMRRGVRSSTFKAGDVVTVSMNPMRSGSPAGKYVSVTARDGTTY